VICAAAALLGCGSHSHGDSPAAGQLTFLCENTLTNISFWHVHLVLRRKCVLAVTAVLVRAPCTCCTTQNTSPCVLSWLQ
jgi:hypothetical protein